VDRDGKTVASVPISLRRDPPESIAVTVSLDPQVTGAKVTIRGDHGDVETASSTDGYAEFKLPPGDFELQVADDRFEPFPPAGESGKHNTGIDEKSDVSVRLLSKTLPVAFQISPPGAKATVLMPDQHNISIALNETGGGNLQLPPGNYRLTATFENYEPSVKDFQVARGVNASVALQLSQIKHLPPPQMGPSPNPDAAALLKMSADDFLAWAQRRFSLATLEVHPPEPNLSVVQVTGTVLSTQEMATLKSYAATAGLRLDVTKVTANERIAAKKLKDALLAQKWVVDVRPFERKNEGGWALEVDYQRGTGGSDADIQRIAGQFVFDPTLIELKGF
jgi:hypothetical protein